MSVASTHHATFTPSAGRVDQAGYLKRSMYMPAPLFLPVMLAAASWLMNGQPWLTDLAFVILTGICILYVAIELYKFPQRFGIGGLVLFGGTLIWFSHDYFSHWLGHSHFNENAQYTAEVIAKAVFCHTMFVMMMAFGLLIPFHRLFTKPIHAIPEPNSPNFYFWMILGLFAVGLSPYILFTRGNPIDSIIADMFAGRAGGGARWTVGRTGNVNYSWGAYAAILLQLGQIGGQLAVFYALLVARTPGKKIVSWAIWFFWFGLAFGSGSRGQVVYMALPAVALLYLKYQSIAAMYMRRISKRAYIYAGVAVILVLFVVQFQGYFRTLGFTSEHADVSRVSLTQLRGSSMFSEGVLGYALIPEFEDFYYNRIPGETLIRPIPQTAYWFAVGPVPRALWKTKPIDPVWEWYNLAFTQGRHGISGTTISQGLVGYWYFRYGIAGIIQGGLLIGWLMSVAEKSLQTSEGKPIRILISLAIATWLFRIFRGVNFNSLYPIIIGGIALYIMIKVINSMLGGQPQGQAATQYR